MVRKAQVIPRGQHLLGTRHERIEQILGRALLGPPFARVGCRWRWGRLSGIARRQNLEVACDPVIALDGRNSVQAEQTPLLAGVMQIEQEVVHLGGPLVLLLLGDGQTIAQQVSATDAMRTVIAIITAKAVVHAATPKARPDADRLEGLSASRLMPGQMGQEAGAVDMQPMQHPIDADACLIGMLQAAGRDQIRNALHRRCQPLGGQLTPLQQARFCKVERD